jgi:signal transduction histidine kinase
MLPLGLLRLCEAIGEIDRSRFADCGLALDWLGRRIHRHTGTAVTIWLAELVGDVLPDTADRSVWVVRWPGEDRIGSVPLGDLRFFDEPADLTDEGRWSDSVRDGPLNADDFSLAVGERALLFRVRLEFALCWVRVSGPVAQVGDLAPWRNLLPPALHGFLRGIHHDDRSRFRDRQDKFFNALLNPASRKHVEVFVNLCRAWQEFAEAQWAWLWLYNPLSNAFELTASACKAGEDDLTGRLPRSFKPTNTSVAAYASLADEVVAVADAKTWRKTYKGQEYRSVIPHDMAARGAGSFVCVPIVATGSGNRAAMVSSEIRGAVCLHFPHLAAMPSMPFNGLRRMGQATAQAIVNSFMGLNHDILLQLNEMAGRYLTATDRDPATDREEYLKELMALIRDRLHFRMVSVFYKVPFRNAVACLASTGLCRRDGTSIPKAKLAEVEYAAGKGRTGDCFSSFKPGIYLDGDGGDSYEVDAATNASGQPFVVYPIPEWGEAIARRAVGVIRCVSQHVLKNRFLQLELEPLKFIARQVGLVLQALESRIRREQTISIVKHDLYSPLTMIRNTVDRMSKEAAADLPLREYDLANLDYSSFFATNLVSQLDPSSDPFGDYDPEPTLLEGDILARVVSMLRPFAWEHSKMKIEFDNIRVIPRLNVDRDMVERAIHNLLVNAIKYGDPKTTIQVAGRKSQAGYCIDIKNDGIGIEADEAPLILQQHYRSPRAKEVGMGLGLGLFIARSVMLKHGGNVFLTKRKGPTIFSLFFPVQLAR